MDIVNEIKSIINPFEYLDQNNLSDLEFMELVNQEENEMVKHKNIGAVRRKYLDTGRIKKDGNSVVEIENRGFGQKLVKYTRAPSYFSYTEITYSTDGEEYSNYSDKFKNPSLIIRQEFVRKRNGKIGSEKPEVMLEMDLSKAVQRKLNKL